LPEALRKLPAGRYAIEPVDQASSLSEAEEAGILEALKELVQGKVLRSLTVLKKYDQVRIEV
jgi:hypothetical protein